MATPLRLDYAVNDAEVIAAFKRQQAEMEKERKARQDLERQINSNAAAQKTADKAAIESERAHTAAVREATAVAEKYATKEERVSAEIKRLNELKAKGVLASKDHARAIAAENAKLAETGDAAGKTGGMFEGLGGKVAGAAAGFASMHAVIGVIKGEYDALIERQGKSRDSHISLAAEQEALLMNLGGADPKQVTGDIRELSKTSGVKEEDVTRAVNDAMAARGDMGVDAVIDAVSSVSKIRKFAPSEMAGLAAATIDTQKQTGLGTDESLGFLLQMQAQSRTKSLKGLAENFTPAVGGVMNFGADRETAGAMLASLSHGMGDTSGAMTGTSGIALAKQLREFSGGQDIGQTITRMQMDPEMRAAFLSKASFETKALPAIESLLSGGKQAQQYSAAKQALQGNPLDALADAVAARDLTSIGLAEKNQALQNVPDQMRLADTKGAESAIVRDRIAEIRQSMGYGPLAVSGAGIIDDMMSGGNQTFEGSLKKLEARSALMSAGKDNITQGLPGPGGGLGEEDWFGRMVYGPSTEAADRIKKNLADKEFVRQAKLMEEMVTLLRQQLAAQEAANAAGQQKAHAGVVAGRVNQREGVR